MMLYKIDVKDQHSPGGELYVPSRPWGQKVYNRDNEMLSSIGFATRAAAALDLYKFVKGHPRTHGIVYKRATGAVILACVYGPDGFQMRGEVDLIPEGL